MIATTHLNSRKASGAPAQETHKAYQRQVAYLTDFISANRNPSRPLIVAGDFNRGQRPIRIAALSSSLAKLASAGVCREGLRSVMTRDPSGLARSPDAVWIRYRARDMQYALDGKAMRIIPVSATIPFGTETDGSSLSDHMGFTIRYRLSSTPDNVT
jgi:hypothetical protein